MCIVGTLERHLGSHSFLEGKAFPIFQLRSRSLHKIAQPVEAQGKRPIGWKWGKQAHQDKESFSSHHMRRERER
jgi:hypothetical protein